MNPLYYFAYGSNLSVKRLRARVPSAEPLGVYSLAGHQLRFHKNGRDGSAKCDAYATGNPQHQVLGVVFAMAWEHKQALDEAEGLGWGYQEKQVEVADNSGAIVSATTYYAIRINPDIAPYDWYHNHVLVGAREAGLPVDYVREIATIAPVLDPDAERAEREWGLYR